MEIFIRFDRNFDFFLSKKHLGDRISYVLNRNASVKDMIESLGIPHTEIGHMTFDRKAVDFSFIPRKKGTLTVSAIKKPFNVLSSSFLRPLPLKDIRFVADVNVIRLGRLLILLGFDVCYSSFLDDSQVADIAQNEKRIVLTRDTHLLKRKKIVFARRIRSNLPYDQLVETVDFFGLLPWISYFSRCTTCNIRLESVSKQDILHLLEPKTKKYYHTFFQCPNCRAVFWKGSHFDHIQKKMSDLRIIPGTFDPSAH